MNSEFKREIMECMDEIGTAVRLHLDYEDSQLNKLKVLLLHLAAELRDETVIEKDRALYLYSLPPDCAEYVPLV